MRNRIALSLLASALIASCSVSDQLVRDLEEEDRQREDFRGFVVYDPMGEKELINFNGSKYFIPASTAKLFTFYTAYMILPDSVPSLEYLERGDTLLIRGTASPLTLEDREDQVLKFLRSRDSQIFLVDESIDDEVYGPGWSWEDYLYAYMPERSLFPLYGNCVRISRTTDSLRVQPEFFSEFVLDSENDPVSQGAVEKAREFFQNRFNASSLREKQEMKVPFRTSNQLAADLLSEALDRKVTLISDPRNEAMKVLRTIPYDSLFVRMLVESDNFIAEQLLLQVGRETDSVYRVQSAIDHALVTYLKDIPQKPRWVDGSGLSRYNLFTPESLVYLLKKMYEEIPVDKLFGYLPAGGVSGTLKDDFKGPDGTPYVYAKSGTLSNNFSLSGYLRTKKGKVLIFSFMDNHHRGSSRDRKEEIQGYLERIWEAY